MKIAVSGKGGVGKTTISAALIKHFSQIGLNVFAVDADPDISLGTVLGLPDEEVHKLPAIVEMKELITERLGDGAYFTLNPVVDDVLDNYSLKSGNIRLLKMGAVKKGGSACYCRENTFLNALLKALVVSNEDIVVLDMGAGIEHLTRGTAKGVDAMLIVTEPSKVSIATAKVIAKLAREIGVAKIYFIANKVRKQEEVEFIRNNLEGENLLGHIPFSDDVLDAAMGKNENDSTALNGAIEQIFKGLREKL